MTMTTQTKTNINSFSVDEKKSLMASIYTTPSYFQKIFDHDFKEFACESSTNAFRNEIERLLLTRGLIKAPILLERLHEVLSDEMKTYNFNDGVNKISTFFYDTDQAFEKVYHQFIVYLRQQIVQEPFWFQATPTIRIHCPNAINSHHYPRYHSDISYGHPPEEINIWFPLTDLLTGHSFKVLSVANSKGALEQFDYDFGAFIESAINDRNFSDYCDSLAMPVDTALGKIFAFDSRCVHTGDRLKWHTRISMDIRILPLSQYEKMTIEYQGSGRRKILFTPGHCYHAQHSDYFLNQGI